MVALKHEKLQKLSFLPKRHGKRRCAFDSKLAICDALCGSQKNPSVKFALEFEEIPYCVVPFENRVAREPRAQT